MMERQSHQVHLKHFQRDWLLRTSEQNTPLWKIWKVWVRDGSQKSELTMGATFLHGSC